MICTIRMQLLQTSHFCFKVMLQKSDPCCCFCKLIEVSSVYGGPGSAKTVDLTSPLIHWPEYGDRSSTAVCAPPHLSFPCCCLTGAAEGLILMGHIQMLPCKQQVSDCVRLHSLPPALQHRLYYSTSMSTRVPCYGHCSHLSDAKLQEQIVFCPPRASRRHSRRPRSRISQFSFIPATKMCDYMTGFQRSCTHGSGDTGLIQSYSCQKH